MNQHTPGPWFTCPQTNKPHSYALVGISNGAVHVGYASVTPAMSPMEADANARMIAAAPELLEVLEDLIEAICDGRLERAGAETFTDPARALITKAKGAPPIAKPEDCETCHGKRSIYIFGLPGTVPCPRCRPVAYALTQS